MVKSEKPKDEKNSKPFNHIFEKEASSKMIIIYPRKNLITSLQYHILRQLQLELND